jgi:hypothetical protein
MPVCEYGFVLHCFGYPLITAYQSADTKRQCASKELIGSRQLKQGFRGSLNEQLHADIGVDKAVLTQVFVPCPMSMATENHHSAEALV